MYFTDAEFACQCGRSGCSALKAPHPSLLLKLDSMRAIYGSPITITSGIRCPEHNHAVGGVPGSEHETGEGADLACPNSSSRWQLIQAALKAGFRRIGVGKTFLHVGVSRTHASDVIWTYY